MARFVHIADGRYSAAIRRDGLKASRAVGDLRGVFCVPVVSDYARTFQWSRELRRGRGNSLVSIFFVLNDAESVLVGHYGREKLEMTAAQAHQFFQSAPEPFGYEVFVTRAIRPKEIKSIRAAPRLIGWRVFPTAKGKRPLWPQAGTRNAERLRQSIEGWYT